MRLLKNWRRATPIRWWNIPESVYAITFLVMPSSVNLIYLIITDNLNVISFIPDWVGVMYLGKLVEIGATPDIFDRPQHPYTEALISTISLHDPRLREY